MSIQKTITSQIKRVLTQLVSQIATQVPSAICNVKEQIVHHIPTVCASFLKALDADTVDLCVEVKSVAECVTVSADLVVGGSGRILSEMAAITIKNNMDIEGAVRIFEEYAMNQTDTIAAELQKGI